MALPEDPSLCSYTGDPATSLHDAVRFWAQDADPDFWFLTDSEIDYITEFVSDTTNSDPMWIASVVAISIAAKVTREVSISADGVSIDTASLQQRFLTLAQTLRDAYDETHGDMELPTPALSGHNPDPRVPPLLFGIGNSDNFDAGRQDYGDRRLITSDDIEDPLETW